MTVIISLLIGCSRILCRIVCVQPRARSSCNLVGSPEGRGASTILTASQRARARSYLHARVISRGSIAKFGRARLIILFRVCFSLSRRRRRRLRLCPTSNGSLFRFCNRPPAAHARIVSSCLSSYARAAPRYQQTTTTKKRQARRSPPPKIFAWRAHHLLKNAAIYSERLLALVHAAASEAVYYDYRRPGDRRNRMATR